VSGHPDPLLDLRTRERDAALNDLRETRNELGSVKLALAEAVRLLGESKNDADDDATVMAAYDAETEQLKTTISELRALTNAETEKLADQINWAPHSDHSAGAGLLITVGWAHGLPET
jgi:GTPase involved in cell partitioning and DNA repair